MPRLHLFEIEDQPWCPPAVRAGGMRYLHFVTNLVRAPWRRFALALAEAMRAVGTRRVVDLCSGAAGPVPTLLGLLDEQGIVATATLTDRYPEPAMLAPTPRIAFYPAPVDARCVPADLSGFRLLCNAFHHFSPDDARRILADAVTNRRGIALVEVVERSAPAVVAAALGLIGVPLTLPFFRPLRWEHALLTYVVPLIPLMTAFDGVVSALRAYSIDEMWALVREADPDGTFDWTIERTRVFGLPIGITWLVGHPRRPRRARRRPAHRPSASASESDREGSAKVRARPATENPVGDVADEETTMRAISPLTILFAACAGTAPGSGSDSGTPPLDPTEDTGPSTPPTWTLGVRPLEATVQTGPQGGPDVVFEATAEWSDGRTDLPGAVTWSLSDPSVGTIADGVFTPSSDIGGRTDVIATFDDVEVRASLVSRWVSVIDGALDTGFDRTATVWPGTSWTYPESGTVLPVNLPSLAFRWTDAGARAYKLQFATETINLTVFTTEPTWTASGEDWSRISRSNAGTDVTARLWASFDGELWEAEPITLSVDAFEAEGSIIYWSTSVSGMIEIPFGGEARDFFTGSQAGACVGCHAISSQGQMAYNRGGDQGTLGMYDLGTQTETVDASQASSGGLRAHYSTFSPDGSRLLTAYNGTLTLRDGTTGVAITEVLTDDTLTHPHWSPDGSQLVFVRSTPCSSDTWLCSAGTNTIERMVWDGSAFGAPEVLFTAPAGEVAYYPVHSPDGQWVVFDRSTGDAYDDPDATLWAMPADGARAPVALARANASGALTNSWPRFAPAGDGETFWVTFASRRGYAGRVQPQIWVSAFDPAAAAAGMDPSSPAFWLPGQKEEQNNHIPTWTDALTAP